MKSPARLKPYTLLRCVSVALLIFAYFLILPISSIASSSAPQDIIIFDSQKASRGKADIPPALFSHSLHKKNNIACNDCHPDIFEPRKGANKITMKENINGYFCGACHMGGGNFRMGNWDMSDCNKCHQK